MMIAQFSTRYTSSAGRRLSKRGPGQKLTLGGWFWKLTGIVVIMATLIGFAGSCWFSWCIRNGLDNLTRARGEKHALQQESAKLQKQRDKEMDRKRIESLAAAKLALYPTKEEKLGRVATVRIPTDE